MSDSLGDEAPGRYAPHVYRKAARYLVIIDSGGSMVARLFDADRTELAEFDAGSEEIAVMTQGLRPTKSALDRAWDDALDGHNHDERRAADVYTLDI
jgi:hypothetical protein